ncbi:MAG: hypothetical protein ACKVVT_17085 [Dehalococcoidia bacterium]
MAQAPTTSDVPQEMRDRAADLGWDATLIDQALGKGFTLQEVFQALQANIDGATAKSFLETAQPGGASIVRPEFAWMKVPTEWGIKARASNPAMGLTIGDINVGTYGDIPDVWHNRSEIARGSFPKPAMEDMGYTIFEKAIVWADCVVPLYEQAIKDRWSSATDLNWNSLEPLSADLEAAVCQLMTELSERSYYQGVVLGRWLPEISYGYLEMKLFMSTVIYDVARHTETFRKRALANGGGLGIQAPTDYSRVVEEARSFPELIANLFVQDSTLLTLFEHGADLAQNQLERDMYALCARDRRRMMDYQIERLKHFLFKMPERRDEQNFYFSKAEHKLTKEWGDALVAEPLMVLLGGGKEKMDQGAAKLAALRKTQVAGYVDHLRQATFFRNALNQRMKAMLDS